MNLMLVLRAEIVCMIILLFLVFISRTYRLGRDGRIFSQMLGVALAHVALDAVTVWTVNHTDTVAPLLNDAAHLLFFMSAVLFAYGLCMYTIKLTCQRTLKRQDYYLALIPAAVYLVLSVSGVLRIDYTPMRGTWASTGPAPIVGYVVGFVYFLVAILSIVLRWRQVARHFKWIMLPMLLVLVASELVQTQVREFLFTGCAVTAITVAFFFTLENPAAVLERKVMMDVLSGLGSRSSYEHDMAEYDREFEENRDTRFTFMFIDINNLRSINGLYGHQEGDSYISNVAVMLMTNLRGAEHIYRMGGDDFLAIYRKADEKVVVRDIRRVQEACAWEKEGKKYSPELAIGYAVSDPKYNSLRDVLRVADYMMFRNKADLKREIAEDAIRHSGTHMNLSGLTDRVFDAMCLVSEEYYPFLTNLETYVTRVAPAMVEYFGLEGEFLNDFSLLWQKYIHPDDVASFTQDISDTLSGRKQYHFVRYRALGKNGEYVQITCRGGVYHGRDGEPDIFAGYMINHGAVGRIDTLTGLHNLTVLDERLAAMIEKKESGIVIRFMLMNLTRTRLLYGADFSAALIRSLADALRQSVGELGEVYSEHGGRFMMVLPDCESSRANELYRQIRRRCALGISVGGETIPVGLLGGAARLPDGDLPSSGAVSQAALLAAEEASRGASEDLVFYNEAGQSGEGWNLLRDVQHDCVMDRSRFVLRFQPIVRAQTGEVVGAEALLRWNSRKLGEVAPGRFIAFLENDPAYVPLGYDILRMAVRTAGRIRRNLPEFRINVNMTATQLLSEDFIPQVLQILRDENYEPGNLILELTERCKEMEFDLLTRRVSELRENGIRVALDDMGTGYSTIDLLLHLPADEIKLDMAFTQELRGNRRHEALARALCETADKDGVEMCFEGVETEEALEYIRTYGNVLVQGYYFDEPLLEADFEQKYCRE